MSRLGRKSTRIWRKKGHLKTLLRLPSSAFPSPSPPDFQQGSRGTPVAPGLRVAKAGSLFALAWLVTCKEARLPGFISVWLLLNHHHFSGRGCWAHPHGEIAAGRTWAPGKTLPWLAYLFVMIHVRHTCGLYSTCTLSRWKWCWWFGKAVVRWALLQSCCSGTNLELPIFFF